MIYRGPGKSKEIPLLTTGTTISSKVINVDLDITDQTADIDDSGRAAADQGARAGERDRLGGRQRHDDQDGREPLLLEERRGPGEHAHRSAVELRPARDQPAHARSTVLGAIGADAARAARERRVDRRRAGRAHGVDLPVHADAMEDEDDPLAVIIRKACSRELTDLGLVFNSLNIKVVQSEVAEARRRQSAVEAQANAEIATAQQTRRAQRSAARCRARDLGQAA